MLAEALRADLFHHALHRRVDRRDAGVIGRQQGAKLVVTRAGDRRHHPVGADGDDPPHVGERHRRFAERTRCICNHRLDHVPREGAVLRAARLRGFRALVDRPHHDVGRGLDLVALEDVLRVAVAGEVDDAAAVVAQRFRDAEQHGVAEAAAAEDDVLVARDRRRRAGGAHHDHGLARLQGGDELRRGAHLQHDQREKPCVAIDPRAGQSQPFHLQPRAVDERRQAFEILQPVELAGLESARRGRRPHHDLDDGRRETIHFVDARQELLVEMAEQRIPRRLRAAIRFR